MSKQRASSSKKHSQSTTSLSRRDARQRAVAILYESKIKNISALDIANSEGPAAIDALTYRLVAGVSNELEAIDEMIALNSKNWDFERLPIVEVSILEIAIFELLDLTNNQAVVINEAVELTKQLSDPKSTSYINGILSTIASQYLVDPAFVETVDNENTQ